MIPKVIHYCWFGGAALSDKETACIDSWKKFLPDYEIRRWDESNFNVSANRYAKEAYDRKKWAFVSDYARFKILYEYGGLYFDTDVELIKPIDDIIEKGAFFGLERTNNASCYNAIAPGLGMGAEKGNAIYREILDYFEKASFINPDGSDNTTTIVHTVTEIFSRHGFSSSENIQVIHDIYLYPPEYFAPMEYYTGDLFITENTRSIHHYAASWFTPEQKRLLETQHKLIRIFGRKAGKALGDVYGVFARAYVKAKNKGLKYTFSYYVKLIGNLLKRGNT